jgi:CheY-like chemotaxis protein
MIKYTHHCDPITFDADLVCGICTTLVFNAHQTSCCGSLYCHHCILAWLHVHNVGSNGSSCLTCRTELTKSMIIPDVRSDRKSADQIRHCPFHAEFGCAFAGNRREVTTHQRTCTCKPVISGFLFSRKRPLLLDNLRVLIVDDSATLLKLTQRVLQNHGHSVDTACDGAKGLAMIDASLQPKGRPYDVILMDLWMPVLNGFDTTRRLRAMEATATTASGGCFDGSTHRAKSSSTLINGDTSFPIVERYRTRQLVIAISANSDSSTPDEAYNSGVDGFLRKPFQYDAFLTEISDLGSR